MKSKNKTQEERRGVIFPLLSYMLDNYFSYLNLLYMKKQLISHHKTSFLMNQTADKESTPLQFIEF